MNVLGDYLYTEYLFWRIALYRLFTKTFIIYIYIMNVLMNNLYKKRSVITGLEEMEWWSMF